MANIAHFLPIPGHPLCALKQSRWLLIFTSAAMTGGGENPIVWIICSIVLAWGIVGVFACVEMHSFFVLCSCHCRTAAL